MATYYAEINELLVDGRYKWIWWGESPRYHETDQTPIFRGGDELFLRIRNCTGKHRIELTFEPDTEKGQDKREVPLPFKGLSTAFEFYSDSPLPAQVLLGDGSLYKWSFTLEHRDGDQITRVGGGKDRPIDPEFHVGAGN